MNRYIGFKNVTAIDTRHWCITDRPDELSDFITPITPFKKSKGWWDKLNLYSPEMPKGHILYLDLDIVIHQIFDHEIKQMKKCQDHMCCVSDAIGWMGKDLALQ